MQQDLEVQYGIDLDLNDAVEKSLKILVQSHPFSETEIVLARELYSQLIAPNVRERHVRKGRCKSKQQQEVALPPKMATGFVLILGGSLLSIIPLGVTQGLGVTLIGSGIYSIVEGAREGETPYYIDSATGNRYNEPP